MRNLLKYLLKYNNLIIFLILEVVALSLLLTRNNYHNTRFVKGITGLTKGMEVIINNSRNYFSLKQINSLLAEENTKLKNIIERSSEKGSPDFISVTDSLFSQRYQFTSAEVINNSVNKQKNFFTLNKGRKHGIEPDMAVVSNKGPAGVVVGCSNNYSVAISLLNLDFRLSARIRSNGYLGSLGWDGQDYRYVILNEIPQHIKINIGDTVETTGYSAIFPEGMVLGRISDYRKSGSDFYLIRVGLFIDFKKLHFVDVIGNLQKTEQRELEKQYQ